jgi:ABC-type uncharacterized transport system substrate-binding protein
VSTATASIGGLVVATQFGVDQERQIAAMGGRLVSYGPKAGQSGARVAAMVDKILKGVKPVDLPGRGANAV